MSIKQCNFFFVILIFTSTLVGQDAGVATGQNAKKSAADAKQDSEDPIADKLQAAKLKFVSEVTVAFEAFVESIDSEIEKTENNTKLSVETQLKKLKELKADRQNVVNGRGQKFLQKSSASASSKYKKQVSASKKALEKAFVRAADQYRRPPLKNFDVAAKTLADRKKFFQDYKKETPVVIPAFVLSRESWKVHYVDSTAANRPIANLFDGDLDTHWITEWNTKNPPKHPHEIQIDLGDPQTFSGLRYAPRKGNWRTYGRVQKFEVYASSDGGFWGAPLTTGVFKNEDELQSVAFKETTARYVRLVALSAYHGSKVAAIAELDLLSSKPQNRAPKTIVLFNGDSLDQFRGYHKEEIGAGWKVEDGTLHFDGTKGSGDIVTKQEFENFVLQFEWKISAGGNSGVMYRVSLGDKKPYLSGPEYQVLDDNKHRDGKKPSTSAGALYALYVPRNKQLNAVGQWNKSKIVLNGKKVEHWLNGTKVVDAEIGSDDWKEKIEASKFKSWKKFGKNKKGHLCFQDHGNKVWYRSITVDVLND